MLLNHFRRTCITLLQGMALMATLLLVPGCASQQPADAPVLVIAYQTVQVSEALDRSGAAEAYKRYWRAHLDRDWKTRFALESNLGNVTEKFYVAYYNKAWAIKTFAVTSVEDKNGETVVMMTMGLVDPDSDKVTQVHRADRWLQRDGQWLHVNDDPFLVGMTQ